MQTSSRNGDTYGKGAFALLCGAAALGVLTGTVCLCTDTDSAFVADTLGYIREDDYARVMAGSLLGSTVFLLGFALLGFCALGQPFEIALLILRGMGTGYSVAEIYASAGREKLLFAAGLVLPGAVISTLALAAAAREALSLSNIYLKLTLSGRTEQSPRDAVKLYGAKMLVIEAILAVAAGADTVCSYLFAGRVL